MQIPVRVPLLGSEGQPIQVSVWYVEPGQVVDEGDRLVELQLPGITFDVSAPATGALASIAAPALREVSEGDTLGTIEVPD